MFDKPETIKKKRLAGGLSLVLLLQNHLSRLLPRAQKSLCQVWDQIRRGASPPQRFRDSHSNSGQQKAGKLVLEMRTAGFRLELLPGEIPRTRRDRGRLLETRTHARSSAGRSARGSFKATRK